MQRLLCLLLVLPLLFSPASAEEWSRFRGPNGQGISSARGLPSRFDPTGFSWKTAVPAGHSSPVLSKGKVFLTAHEGDTLVTLALDATIGTTLWRREAPRPRQEGFHRLNGPASTTPVSDGRSVFVFFGDFGLIAYDLDGNERWQRPLGPFLIPNGHGSSPILAAGHLILQVDQDRGSYLIALDPATGSERWQVLRSAVTHGYSTPVVFQPAAGPPQLIVTSSYHTAAYALKDGARLWWAYGTAWQTKPSAVVSADTVFVTGAAPGGDSGEQVEMPVFEEVLRLGDTDKDGKLSEDEVKAGGWRHRGGWGLIDLDDDNLLGKRDWQFYRARRAARNATLALRPAGRRGDLTDKAVVWSYRRAIPVVPCPLLDDGILYTVKKGGILTALDADNGKVLKQARLPDAAGAYYASPVIADGKLYLINEEGKITVVRPGTEWEVVSTSSLEELCFASPALADGVVYIRTASHLYAFAQQ